MPVVESATTPQLIPAAAAESYGLLERAYRRYLDLNSLSSTIPQTWGHPSKSAFLTASTIAAFVTLYLNHHTKEW